MNTPLQRITALLLAMIFVAGTWMLLRQVKEERMQKTCEKLQVEFKDSLKFVSEKNIRDYMDKAYGKYVGSRIDSLELDRIEKLLESKSAIMRCEAWITDDGVLHVGISQRAPAVRLMYGEDEGFYCDETGYIFPLHSTFTAPVPTIKGNIPMRPEKGYKGFAKNESDRDWLEGLLSMQKYINNSARTRNLVKEISVADNGDLTLTTNSGDEVFIFGKASDIEEKFDKIDKYYAYIRPNKSEEDYKVVNLKYKKQIICRKDI